MLVSHLEYDRLLSERDKLLLSNRALEERVRSGKIHPKGAMFLRVHGGTASTGRGKKKREYEVSAGAVGMAPIVESKQTGKTFTLTWDEIIRMAIERGIDK